MVGVSGERVSPLCEVTDPEEVADLALRTGAPAAQDVDDFERLLLEEATDYREVAKREVTATRSPVTRPRRAGKPLYELLHRLRTLQSR
jgi:hypothetical protein